MVKRKLLKNVIYKLASRHPRKTQASAILISDKDNPFFPYNKGAKQEKYVDKERAIYY